MNASSAGLSVPLQALIIAVSTVAAAALGLWLAGPTGLVTGALSGIGLGFSVVHLISCPSEKETPRYSLKDSTIKWLMGTQSPTLALMTAVYRQGKAADLADKPALIPIELLLDRDVATLTSERYPPPYMYTGMARGPFIKGTHTGVPEKAVYAAMHPVEAFDLNKTLQKAYDLPGNNGKSYDVIGEYLLDLQVSIVRVLQAGITDEEKADLKAHIQNNLLPIFVSGNILREYLYAKIGQSYSSRNKFDENFSDHDCNYVRPEVNALLELFDRIETLPLSPDERRLIDQPCPLIFTSTNIDGESLVVPCQGRSADDEQRMIYEPALLGRDLQYVYTTAANIERIRAAVMPFNVLEVRDIDDLMMQREELR